MELVAMLAFETSYFMGDSCASLVRSLHALLFYVEALSLLAIWCFI
jgi:hypothetical protein